MWKLAKFGYRSEMDIENFFNPTIFWRPAGTSVLFFGEISQCGHHIFFMVTRYKALFWEKGGRSRHILSEKKVESRHI
jgi:hypothetical protein